MNRFHTCLLGLLASPMVMATTTTSLPAAIENAFSTYTDLPSVLVPVLQQATDKASADNAAKELEKKLPAIYEARQKIRGIPQLTEEQNQQVQLQYGQRMREEWAKMYYEIVRIQRNRCFYSSEMGRVFRLMCMMIEK